MTKKLIAAAALLLALALISCACSRDASYIAEYGGGRIPVSDYALKMFTAFAYAKNETGEGSNDVSAILSGEIDSEPAENWIQDETLRLLKEQLAVDAEFERLGLTLSDEDIAEADSEADEQWEKYSGVYVKNGVEKASLIASSRSNFKPQYIFEALYGEGGEKALAAEELAAFFDAECQLFRVIGVTKRGEDGKELGKKELEEQLERAADYKKRLQNGEDGDALVAQAEEELCELLGQELDHEHTLPLASHISVTKTGDLLYSVEMMEFIERMSPGGVALYEDDEDYYFVVQKLSAADDARLLEDNRLAVSYELRLNEFSEYIAELTGEVELTLNDAALKYHSPQLFVLS